MKQFFQVSRSIRPSRALKLGVLAAALLAGTSAMHAASITFTGSDTGTFANMPSGSGLSFTGTTFTGSTDNFGGLSLSNLGTFSLTMSPTTYYGTAASFTLNVVFTAPTGVVGPSTYNASITGQVLSDGSGGASIDFNPNTQAYSYNGGTFTFTVQDVDVKAGSSTNVSGRIVATASPVAVTPEPSSLLLLGTGAIGTAGFIRRKFQA